MRRLALLVVCCLALAGCNGLAASDDQTGTLTPAPVPNETDRPASVSAQALPPGVSATGIENVGALLSAHEAQLGDQPYVLYGDRRVVDAAFGSEPAWERQQFTVAVAGPTVWRLAVARRNNEVDETTPPWSNYTVYANGSARFIRRVNETGVQYAVRDRVRERDTFARIVASTLRRLLSDGPATVDRVERDGQEYVRIRQRNASLEAGEGAPTYEATLLVTDEGLIRRARIRYRDPAAQRQAATIRTVTFHYREVGSADPQRPDWLAEARTNGTEG
jgi:hypothetical protein